MSKITASAAGPVVIIIAASLIGGYLDLYIAQQKDAGGPELEKAYRITVFKPPLEQIYYARDLEYDPKRDVWTWTDEVSELRMYYRDPLIEEIEARHIDTYRDLDAISQQYRPVGSGQVLMERSNDD